jgi:2-keto-4-pentenoate hydratase
LRTANKLGHTVELTPVTIKDAGSEMAVRGIAEAFVNARSNGIALPEYPGTSPASLPAAYAIQDEALAIWNRSVGGWKVGKIKPPLDRQLGANRLAGPIFTDMIFSAADDPTPMPVFQGGFAAVEAEFMLKLSPPDDAVRPPETNAEARHWVSEVRIGLEIASSPYPHINRDGPCVTVSDHGNNHGIVLGQIVAKESWDNLDDIAVSLSIDGVNIASATTATMLDGAFGAVRFILSNLSERNITIQPNWWISTGAITGIHEIAAGQVGTAYFKDIGSVQAIIC